jgi:hypothetical protein
MEDLAMVPQVAVVVIAVVAMGLLVLAIWKWLAGQRYRAFQNARQQFYRRREWLEAEFLKLASRSGLPRGLAWVNCDFENQVQFAKDRASGQLRALVAVTISFAAVEGGGMEQVEAVGDLRAATALFYFDGKTWRTTGRALFNLNPAEAIHHYRHELETVD